jgi:glycosyltransferase involved in cell wall biosynthesis
MNSDRIGIDFIGLPKGSLGVGEQLRCLIRLAELNNYAINIIDCYKVGDVFENNVGEFNHYISNEFKNNIRLYSATHTHMVSLLWNRGFKFFDNKKNIFHFAWEFSEITPELRPVITLCDEVWGISKFTAEAFKNNYGIPVQVLPNSINCVGGIASNRALFSLPQDMYLFSTSFDFNSFLERKNPNLTVKAFIDAFGVCDNIGLVVKIINGDLRNLEYRKFIELVSSYKNMYIINKVLEKKDVLVLFNSCDAYISLHRSEGFGFGIAENMMLGKPVICTGFSGNMDFCNQSNAFLVDYSLVNVPDGCYQNAKGLLWADPSLDSATKLIKEVYENRSLSRLIAKRGQEAIRQGFDTQVIAKIFKERIESLEVIE